MIVVLAAATNEPNAGWGRLVAMLLTFGAFSLGASIHKRWLAVKDQPLPPAEKGIALEGVKSQVSTGPDPKVTPSQEVATKADADLDGFVRTRVGSDRPSQIIRAAQQRYRVSQSTVKRAIRRAKGQS